jgi:hypothetical protein
VLEALGQKTGPIGPKNRSYRAKNGSYKAKKQQKTEKSTFSQKHVFSLNRIEGV